jgi:hypothetical protein
MTAKIYCGHKQHCIQYLKQVDTELNSRKRLFFIYYILMNLQSMLTYCKSIRNTTIQTIN